MSVGVCDTCHREAEVRFSMCKSCFLDFKAQLMEWVSDGQAKDQAGSRDSEAPQK